MRFDEFKSSDPLVHAIARALNAGFKLTIEPERVPPGNADNYAIHVRVERQYESSKESGDAIVFLDELQVARLPGTILAGCLGKAWMPYSSFGDDRWEGL